MLHISPESKITLLRKIRQMLKKITTLFECVSSCQLGFFFLKKLILDELDQWTNEKITEIGVYENTF